MISHENEIRVSYDQVDKMGYMYHGNYARFYHISRTEFFRFIGISEKELEEHHILMPVIEMNIQYYKPVFYDDIISIQSILLEIPTTRMKFKHEVYNENNELINNAYSTLVFVDSVTRKPMKIPDIILNKLMDLKNHKTNEKEN